MRESQSIFKQRCGSIVLCKLIFYPTMPKLLDDILCAKDTLLRQIHTTPPTTLVEGTGGTITMAELLAYQIGWGKYVVRWYEAGLIGKMPEMPGHGFTSWDYTAIAQHFYRLYQYDSLEQQIQVFQEVVDRIIAIIQTEHETGNLDKTGVWPWCTLRSGKEWPLSKWIQVNTAAPYKRACQLIKKALHG